MGKNSNYSLFGPRRTIPQKFWVFLLMALVASVVFDVVNMAVNQSVRADDKTEKVENKSDENHDDHEHETSEDGKESHTGHGDGHEGEHHAGGHQDPVSPIVLAMAIILVAAKLGGDLFERVQMPAVLGELVVGILIGNMALLTSPFVEDGGWKALEFFKVQEVHSIDELETDDAEETIHELEAEIQSFNPYSTGAVLKMLAGIGVLILLFEVGLESSVAEMVSVGTSSIIVAILGVIAPMGLGWGVGYLMVPELGWQVHAFMGATLCATSVGITARVLKDIGCSQKRESQIILGAAVIDDVLGLIVLAVVSGVISTGSLDPMELGMIVLKAFGFLVGAVFLGNIIFTRPLFKFASYLRGHGMLVACSLVICFGFSFLSNYVFGLAPIVGAFAAGLILEHAHYRELGAKENTELEHAIQPISAVLVPIFFVQMGIQVDLTSFANTDVLLLAGALSVVAIIGKQVCSLGVMEKGLNVWAVGLGMIPRGEVGLIFADEGKKLTTVVDGVKKSVIDDGTFSAIVVMVIVTTMITPPVLKWAMLSGDKLESADGDPPADE